MTKREACLANDAMTNEASDTPGPSGRSINQPQGQRPYHYKPQQQTADRSTACVFLYIRASAPPTRQACMGSGVTSRRTKSTTAWPLRTTTVLSCWRARPWWLVVLFLRIGLGDTGGDGDGVDFGDFGDCDAEV